MLMKHVTDDKPYMSISNAKMICSEMILVRKFTRAFSEMASLSLRSSLSVCVYGVLEKEDLERERERARGGKGRGGGGGMKGTREI